MWISLIFTNNSSAIIFNVFEIGIMHSYVVLYALLFFKWPKSKVLSSIGTFRQGVVKNMDAGRRYLNCHSRVLINFSINIACNWLWFHHDVYKYISHLRQKCQADRISSSNVRSPGRGAKNFCGTNIWQIWLADAVINDFQDTQTKTRYIYIF